MGATKEWLVEGVIPARVHCVIEAQTEKAARRKALQLAQDLANNGQTDSLWWFDDDNNAALTQVEIAGVSEFRP